MFFYSQEELDLKKERVELRYKPHKRGAKESWLPIRDKKEKKEKKAPKVPRVPKEKKADGSEGSKRAKTDTGGGHRGEGEEGPGCPNRRDGSCLLAPRRRLVRRPRRRTQRKDIRKEGQRNGRG